jgi:hypothetical protein
MSEEEKAEYAKMLIAMSTDYLMAGITWETFVSNLKIVSDKLQREGK